MISALLAAGILEMRGIAGKPGWFWLFLLEGLLTVVIAFISFLYLPWSPTDTKSVLFRKGWYTEREEIIMVNRILRDDPAKGLTGIKEPATWKDIKAAWSDSSMWGLYFIGLIAVSVISRSLRRLSGLTTGPNSTFQLRQSRLISV